MSLRVCDVCVRTIRLFVHVCVCVCVCTGTNCTIAFYFIFIYLHLLCIILLLHSFVLHAPLLFFLTNWFVCVCVFDVLGGFMEI